VLNWSEYGKTLLKSTEVVVFVQFSAGARKSMSNKQEPLHKLIGGRYDPCTTILLAYATVWEMGLPNSFPAEARFPFPRFGALTVHGSDNAVSLDITVRAPGAKMLMAAISVANTATNAKTKVEGNQAGIDDGEKGL
jgi:hypothetical protein